MRKVAEGSAEKCRSQESGTMACSRTCSCRFKRCGALTVTFSNDSVSRSKRPLQDMQEGDQPLQQDAKKQRWEKFCGSPSPSSKAPQPSILSSPSNRAASQAYPPTTNKYRDDSDLDASLLEPSDGEEPDSPLGLSPEAEAKLLEDDPGDYGESFPPFIIFGIHARKVESSCIPTSPKAQSISKALEKPIGAEPVPPTGPSDLFRDGLVCRSDSGVPECGSHLNRGSQNQAGLGLHSNHPVFPEAVTIEAASVSPLEKEGNSSAVIDEEATRAVREDSAVGLLTAGVSASLMAKGPSEEQECLVQELGRESAGHPPGESEGEWNSDKLLGEAATLCLNSASNQSEDHMENPSTKRPKSPVRPRQQIRINQADLEGSMRSYISAVFAHAHHDSRLIGPVNELHALMQRVSSENHFQGHTFRHPADLTMRNYAERANRPTKRCTLGQWFLRNQRDRPLFADIPDRFERSPIPSL